jgi:hypothetical protein
MPAQQNAPKGSSRKVGRNKIKCKIYREHGIRLKRKIKHILHSNGVKAVESYRKDSTKPFPKGEK